MMDSAANDELTGLGDGVLLTSDLLMDRLGVYDLMTTKELILRDEELTDIDPSCAQQLVSLEILSLSHNRLASLDQFQHFAQLIELNLNFNQISTLANLSCMGLEKLFVANNKIADISPLRSFHKLNTISLYGNAIADLESTVRICRSFPKLRCLDLGGNPCSCDADGYKFQVVRLLPRLKTLDGEQVTQLDKDLAEDFMANRRPATSADSRPFTPATASGSRALRSARWEMPTPQTNKPFDPMDVNSQMPRGNVRLFRDDFLNNNPILLEYLVQEAQDSPRDGDGDYDDNDCSEAAEPDDDARPTTPGFVERLRAANPATGNGDARDGDNAPQVLRDGCTPSLARPSTASTLNVQTSNLGVDPSDPNTTIRKLLKHIELLMETVASYKSRQSDACSLSLLEENKQLQIENQNIPILQQQIDDLKKMLMNAGARPSDCKRMKELESENARLKRDNDKLKQVLKARENEENPVLADSPREEGFPAKSMRLGNTELLDQSASMDVELTELILQNEISLELIRNDIKNTKKEWELQFQQAKEHERNRVRPSTSLGIPSACSTSTNLPSSATRAGKPVRQIHTSAGVRYAAAGPQVQLLRQAAPTASTRLDASSFSPVSSLASKPSASRSTTADILTL